MKNLCCLYKLLGSISIQGLLITVLLYSKFFDINSDFIYSLVMISFLFVCYFSYKLTKQLNNASRVCSDIRAGNFESRIINHVTKGPTGKLFNNINNSIDVCDSFVRESYLVMKAVSEGRYHRKIRSESMLGSFAISIKGINHAVDSIAEKAKTERSNKNMMEKTIKELINLIGNAKNGVLSTRIDSSDLSGEFKEIIDQTNQLMDAIQEPISKSMELIQYIAKGNLNHRIDSDFKGSFGQMKDSLNETSSTLKDIVNKIKSSAFHVSTASKSISEGSTDLSERTEAQASGLEETAASVESISETLRSSTIITKEAAKKASSAKDTAMEGGEIVKQVISAMSRIEQSSKEITEIIGTINEISFQTNILALNASIEAARAGKHGRGFDVVAGEVRALAARSTTSAQEIQQRIQNSLTIVSEGVDLVNQAGNVLDGIVSSNNELSEDINKIVESSVSQSSAIDEISAATNHMDEMTQKNASLVQESTASAMTLSSHAQELYDLMKHFDVDGNKNSYNEKSGNMNHMTNDHYQDSATF